MAEARPPSAAAPAENGAPPPAGDGEHGASETDRDEAFALRLPVFEGPLELLLHLIEREELDITEVSLVAVTGQYLEHLRRRDRIDLGAVAGFVAVGARLLLLKSRALLPRPEAGPDSGDEERDPGDLLEALREYRRYRAAAEHLRGLEDERRTAYRRETPPPEVPPGAGLDGVTAGALLALFREALERLPREEPEAGPAPQTVRLEDRMRRLVRRLAGGAPLRFADLVAAASTRVEVIVDFLAVLELVRAGYAEARQDGAFGEIELAAVPGAAPPPAAAPAEDEAPAAGAGTAR